jgi:hypothetical protein
MNLSSFKATIRIDDPLTGVVRDVKIRVKRMTVEEGTRFSRDYQRSANPPSDILIARKPEGDEQEKRTINAGAKNEREVFVIDDATIKLRRLAEMSVEDQAKYHAMDDAEEAFSHQFLTDTLKRYVRVDDVITTTDDFEDADAEPMAVRTGADLARAFGGREDVLRDLLRVVHLENSQNEQAKKVLRPLFGFVPSSDERETDQHGQKPAPVAEPVASAVSVTSEDAGQAEANNLCGSAAPI